MQNSIKSVKPTQGRIRLLSTYLSNWPESGDLVLFPFHLASRIAINSQFKMQSWGCYVSGLDSIWEETIKYEQEAAIGNEDLLQLRLSPIFTSKYALAGQYIQLSVPKLMFQLGWLPENSELLVSYLDNGPVIWTMEAYDFHVSSLS